MSYRELPSATCRRANIQLSKSQECVEVEPIFLQGPHGYLGSGRSMFQCLLWDAKPPQVGARVRAQGHVAGREHGEAGDASLSALVVAVEKLDGPRLVVLDDLAGGGVPGVLGITEGALPESDVADGDVQIAGLPLELIKRRVRCRSPRSGGPPRDRRGHPVPPSRLYRQPRLSRPRRGSAPICRHRS